MTKLNGRRVLVVGGSSGIGLAIAQMAAEEGAWVRAGVHTGNARKAVLDTANESGIDEFFTSNPAWDHIVFSAAQTAAGPVRKLALEDAKSAMESKGNVTDRESGQYQRTVILASLSRNLEERPLPIGVIQTSGCGA